jgi:hypothetical protein
MCHRYVQITLARLASYCILYMLEYTTEVQYFPLRGGATSKSEQGWGIDGVPDQVNGGIPNPIPVPHGLDSIVGVQKRQSQRIRPFVPLAVE